MLRGKGRRGWGKGRKEKEKRGYGYDADGGVVGWGWIIPCEKKISWSGLDWIALCRQGYIFSFPLLFSLFLSSLSFFFSFSFFCLCFCALFFFNFFNLEFFMCL